MLVLSPHLDDGVLSAGQALAACPDSIVLTIFAGVPESELPLTNFDVQSGFKAAHEAVESRRAEDRRACAVVSATVRHLAFFDRQYAMPADEGELIATLRDEIEALLGEDDRVMLPLGLVHPDHAQTRRCGEVACTALGVRPIFYEDLPARVLWPEAVITKGLESIQFPVGDQYLKEAAMACYRSQRWALDRHACLVPERFWRPS